MILESCVFGKISMKNRIIRSATWEGMCDRNGKPTEKLIKLYEELAENNVGLIITGYSYVSKDGIQLPGMLGVDDDENIDDLKNMVERVHNKGGKIVVQIVHAGGQANRKSSGCQPIAPSAVEFPTFSEIPKEMTKDVIKRVVEAFGDAAKRVKLAGFDGVQLHGAHGYLINQFLSPVTNRRTDEYGGSLENRVRFLKEVLENVRSKVGNDYPVWIKLNCDDFIDGGFSIEEAVIVAKWLEEWGIDAIEVSGGSPASKDKSPARTKIDDVAKEAYHKELAKKIKDFVNVPVAVVGGIRSFEIANKLIEENISDAISLSRPLIREINLIKRWESGDTSRSKCISCNGCFMPGIKEDGIYCVVEKRLAEKEK
ncbi:NADH:flavin oxidoreductase [Deferribacter thermophilus]|uniref:NADH:flavin oxidoreductase n=1 Tax=Deferribacter thermophilus TaxID=53573 RepID=UPI003C1B941B